MQDESNLLDLNEKSRPHFDHRTLEKAFGLNGDFADFISDYPRLINERLEAQEGCFIFRNVYFEKEYDLIEYFHRNKFPLRCFDININLFSKIEEILKRNDVTKNSLKLY